MMLATWLVEFYLSKCNELDDLVASESVSQDVDNLLAERAILEDDLRHFFETYKAGVLLYYALYIVRTSEICRPTSTPRRSTNSFKVTVAQTCICTMQQWSATSSESSSTGSWKRNGRRRSM